MVVQCKPSVIGVKKARPFASRPFMFYVMLFTEKSSDHYASVMAKANIESHSLRDHSMTIQRIGPPGREWAILRITGVYSSEGSCESDIDSLSDRPKKTNCLRGKPVTYRYRIMHVWIGGPL